jgi:hypothetical protein
MPLGRITSSLVMPAEFDSDAAEKVSATFWASARAPSASTSAWAAAGPAKATANATAVRAPVRRRLRAKVGRCKKISSWAAILFAPTLVGTIYGMNFDEMPELNWTFGYPFTIGLMAVVCVSLYFIFKRRDWL